MAGRQDVKRGPGSLIFDGGTFFDKNEIAATVEIEKSLTSSALHGDAGHAHLDTTGKVTFTPLGEWENLTKLYPYLSSLPGDEMMTATDKPVVVHGRDTERITYAAGCITQMPEIICSPTETLFGQAEITCLRAADADWDDSNSLYTIDTAAFSHAAFSKAAILRVPFTAAWGSSPWDAIRTETGWRISFNLEYDFVTDDEKGKVGVTFKRLEVMARCTPLAKSMTAILAAMNLQGGSARRGQSMEGGSNLVLTGAGGSPVITVNKPIIERAGFRWGSTTLRSGEIGFIAQRTFSSGVPQPLLTLA